MSKPVIIIGGGGHSKVLIETLKLTNREILGVTERNIIQSKIIDIEIIGDDSIIEKYSPDEIELVNGIGSISTLQQRQSIFLTFTEKGYQFCKVVHPSAIISPDAYINQGVQIMAGAIIQPGCIIGQNSIINTRSIVDHDCKIGNHVHIAPGVTMSGNVQVKESVHIGTGATVIQGITINESSLVAAGAVVVKDVEPYTKVMGVPAREVKI